MQSTPTARIILEDGTEFEGASFGHEQSIAGEIVFYTGLADLGRILTDPALRGTIVVIAQPQVGSLGIPSDEPCPLGLAALWESSEGQVSGLVVADHGPEPSHWTAHRSLARWLKTQKIPAISGVDTRVLIQRIRDRGSMRAKILVEGTKEVSFGAASSHNTETGASCRHETRYGSGERAIYLVDYGARHSTIRSLVTPETSIVRVPIAYDYSDDAVDGLVVAGGPGDPTACEKTISILRAYLRRDSASRPPIFATGQGAVLLAIAAGASAYRLPCGHRGASVPCVDLASGRCHVTAQNHGYGIRDNSLPAGWEVSFLNDADRSIEGFTAEEGRVSGALFQPEGYPGPHSADFLYANFLAQVCDRGDRR